MRLRFSTRDILWLTALVALALGWFLDHRRHAEQSRPYLTMYHVKSVDPKFALKALQTAFAVTPEIRMDADPTTNMIVIWSSKSQQAEIQDILRKLDQDPQLSPAQRNAVFK